MERLSVVETMVKALEEEGALTREQREAADLCCASEYFVFFIFRAVATSSSPLLRLL